MKVGLINVYSTENVGDAAIYAALGQLLSDYQVSALINPDQAVKEIQGIGLAPISTRCDTYISVGGDIFNNSRPKLVTRNVLYNLMLLARQPDQTILFGQSIPGSCKGLAFLGLCKILKKLASVTVRDKISWQRLNQAGIKAHLSYDLAFIHRASLAAINEACALFESQNLKPEKSVLISIRHFDRLYPQDNHLFIENIAALCKMLRAHDLKPVFLLQSEAEGDDLEVTKAIGLKVKNFGLIDVLKHPKNVSAHDFLQALTAIAGLVIGVRYHSTVLALASGRLPFNLYYSNKGQDLCERLDIPGCDISNLRPEEHIYQIIESVGRYYDDSMIRQHVMASFYDALQTLPKQQVAG